MMKNISNRLAEIGWYVIIILLTAVNFHNVQAQIQINEVSSSNSDLLIDEDGDDPDWIEIKNSGSTPIDLSGYSISDRNDTARAWKFPSYTMESNDFLVIFASGKDRREFTHWETIIDLGDVWKYLLPASEPSADWRNTGFDETGWSSGKTGIGYSDNDDATVIAKTVSLFARKTFTIADTSKIHSVVFNIDFDDAFIAYLNGEEIARDNIGSPGESTPFNQTAITWREALMKAGGEPLEFKVPKKLLNNGENVLAVQVHNYGINSSDMSFLPFLTLGMNSPPASARGLSSYLSFPGSFLHTDFKIDADGESLFLFDSGYIVDSLAIPPLSSNVSYGRNTSGIWNYFPTPTAGAENTTQGFVLQIDEPVFNYPSGVYPSELVLVISKSNPSAVVRYTTDGSPPDKNSKQYTSPIRLTKTTVVKARSFASGAFPSKVSSATYLIKAPLNLPVFSISTSPGNLWDADSGIYVMGRNAESQYPFFGANFWQDWEKPAHIDFFDAGDSLAFGSDCGIKIFGMWSRGADQKSLAVFFRGQYGQRSVDYQLFPQLPIKKYSSFVLRNSGNDWSSTLFRDGLIVNIARGMEILSMAFRPAVVYLNGEYWGIHNLREKINEDYISAHFGVDRENLDMLALNNDVLTGDDEAYIQLTDFVENNSLVSAQNYSSVAKQVDIEQFIDYQILNIFIDNTDWPGNNIKYWRDRAGDKKWRWISYDLDFGFGLFDWNAKRHNTLEFATEANGPGWPNPPWATLLLRKLLENKNFEDQFIGRFADLLNSNFKSERVIALIDSLSGLIEPEINSHIAKWSAMDRNSWNNNVDFLRDFAKDRPLFMRSFMSSFFNLNGSAKMNVDINESGAGTINLNTLKLTEFPWSGFYFYGHDVELEAIPAPGYIFKEWSGDVRSTNQKIVVNPRYTQKLTAVFVKAPPEKGVVINEINYNSNSTADSEDWIELFNNSDEIVDLSNWVFKDEDSSHTFSIPEGMNLGAYKYLVLVRDSAQFRAIYPTCENFIGQFDFGLSNSGEKLFLYDGNGQIVDSVAYSDSQPWPPEADGTGSTLELIDPSADNNLPANWGASSGSGTPGRKNGLFTDIHDEPVIPAKLRLEQNYPNPFNPVTTIRFSVPPGANAPVKLFVFDALGRKVAVLTDRELASGWHSEQFDASHLPSGVYFYSLSYGDKTLVKKLLLLK